jgi:enoyl-CoA hydratase/carnithine racemase
VAVVTLRRPDRLNALTADMRRELAAILRHFGGGQVRGIVVTGTGRAFSAGLDLPENSIGLTISNASSMLLPRLVGHQAMRLVMESARIGAAEGLALGLLDEIVELADLIETAIGLVHRWTRPGAATAAHLRLLRPSLAAIEQAMAAETEAASGPEAAAIAAAGINRFLSRRDARP